MLNVTNDPIVPTTARAADVVVVGSVTGIDEANMNVTSKHRWDNHSTMVDNSNTDEITMNTALDEIITQMDGDYDNNTFVDVNIGTFESVFCIFLFFSIFTLKDA